MAAQDTFRHIYDVNFYDSVVTAGDLQPVPGIGPDNGAGSIATALLLRDLYFRNADHLVVDGGPAAFVPGIAGIHQRLDSAAVHGVPIDHEAGSGGLRIINGL